MYKSSQLKLHTLFGLLALTIGYPYGGTVFILVMMPYLMFMVFKNNAIFLPALILHCASETSATTIIFFSFIILSILKYKDLVRLKLASLFWILIGLLPVFLWLVWQRINIVGDYPPITFSYIGYYLSFFAFFYGVLVAKTFNRQILMIMYYMLFVVFVLYAINALNFPRISVAFTFLYVAALPLFLKFRNRNNIILVISIFAIGSLLSGSEESTFTMLFVCLLGFTITYLYFKNKTGVILKMTGIIPFVLIFALYGYGIGNYMNSVVTDVPEGIDLTSWSSLSDRLSFKFFADRAPFWAGGFQQIALYQPIFPIVDMPDINATFQSGKELEVTFGSHTTFIELIRRFGILAGGLLGYCLIYIVIISRKVFKIKNLDKYIVPLFSMAFICTIVLSLTGTFELLPGYSLLSIGVLGIAYFYSATNYPSTI
jgi:hypothetical protein